MLPTKNRRTSSTPYRDFGYGNRRPGISLERIRVPQASCVMRRHVPNALRRRHLVVDRFGTLNRTVLATPCDVDGPVRYLRYGSCLEILDSPLLADTYEPVLPVPTQHLWRQPPQHLRSVRLQRPDRPRSLRRRHRTPVDMVRHGTANGVNRVRPVVHEDRIELIGTRPAFTCGFPAPQAEPLKPDVVAPLSPLMGSSMFRIQGLAPTPPIATDKQMLFHP